MDIEEIYKIYLQHPSIQTDSQKTAEKRFVLCIKGRQF